MEVRRIQNDELYHHGVKGQKWGVRRYQNPDGSLTPEGMKKYGTTNKYLSLKDRRNYVAQKSADAGGKVMLTGLGVAAAGVVGRKIIGHKIKQTLKDDSSANVTKMELARFGVKHGARLAAIGLTVASIKVAANKAKKLDDKTLKLLTPEQKERLKKLDILDKKISELGDPDDEKYPHKEYQKLVNQYYKIYDEDDRFASGTNKSKVVKKKEETKPKEHKLTVADIDDKELIDVYIDEPELRKEYNISNADYQRYKKTGKI